eukprot:gene6703-8300_t
MGSNNLGNQDDWEKPQFITHTLTNRDTLQGIALKYGVSVNEIKRINKIWTQDTLFIKKSLLIPIIEDNNSPATSSSIGSTSSNNNNNQNHHNNNESYNNYLEYDNHNNNNNNNQFSFSTTTPKSIKKEKPILPAKPNGEVHWRSVPMSTISLSPLVNSLDQKTQSQLSLLDEEFNPL